MIDPVSVSRQAVLAALGSVEPIVTVSHDDLVVIALGSRNTRPADYLTLADDQPAAFDFTELEAGGSVPTVQVKVGLQPLVVLAGETIVGGKQNRIINVSLWLTAQKTTPIPVSCLEHGRWNAGHRFAAGRPVDLDLRAKVSRMVGVQASSASPRFQASSASPRFASDQGGVCAVGRLSAELYRPRDVPSSRRATSVTRTVLSRSSSTKITRQG